MKAKKLVLCLLLSVAMVVTFIPLVSYAEDGDEHIVSFYGVTDATLVGGMYEMNLEHGTAYVSAKDYEYADSACFYAYEGGAFGFGIDCDEGWDVDLVEYSMDGGDVYTASYDEGWVEFDLPVADEGEEYGAINLEVFFMYEGDYEEISSVDVNVIAPLCGTVVTGDGDYGPNRQKPLPAVTVPAGAKYKLYEGVDDNYAMWINKDGTNFNGTIKADQTYNVIIWLQPKEDTTIFTDNCKANVTGGKMVGDPYIEPDILSVEVELQPVHNWSHAVNPAPGLLKNGTQYDQCLGCGATQNAAVAPGWANYYVKGLKVAKGKGSLTVKWKKQGKKNLKKFNGYQIRYATKSNMSDAKYKTAGKKAASKKIGKLKKKTTYYVQVRTYTKKGGVTYYSKWSGTKKVKTK